MRFKYLILLLVVFSCKKDTFDAVNIIGHAGNGLSIQSSIYSPNSLEAIELALGTVGVEGVEIDVQLSKDNELWLFHDPLLENGTTGNGCIAEKTFEELNKIQFKTFNREKLVQLKDLNFSKYSGKTIYLDIKHYSGCTYDLLAINQVLSALNETLSEWKNSINFIVLLNNYYWLNGFSNAGWTTYAQIHDLPKIDSLIENNFSFDGTTIRNKDVTSDDIQTIKSKNKKVILFDIRAPKSLRQALEKQPDGIIVDDVKGALIEKSK